MCLCLEGESLGWAPQSSTQWTVLAAEQFTLCFQSPWARLALQEKNAGGIFHRVFISTDFLLNIWIIMWLLIHFVVWLLYGTNELSGEMGVETLSLLLFGCLVRKAFRHWTAAPSPHGFCVLQNTLLWERLPPRKNSFISFKSILECLWKNLFRKETVMIVLLKSLL